MPASPDFASRLLSWFDVHGRHDLPWQQPRSAYRVWVAEVMLQQTQVVTVIPYYQRFMQRFPSIASLASASVDEVLAHWAGLGYYSRARNLHRAARCIRDQHAGRFPRQLQAVMALPGIGRSTAGAILAQAFGQRHAIVDGNVRRVLCRYHAVQGWPGRSDVNNQLWQLSEHHLPQQRLADYTQAIMDLGATVCTRARPACAHCPLSAGCQALAQQRVSQLPTPRPRKPRPIREVRLLMIENMQGELLLERRPPSGIWGGLWSLPELPEQADPVAYCRSQLAVEASVNKPLPELQHALTHFQMHIKPLHMLARQPTAVLESDGLLWYNPQHTPPGLPRPVQKLLQSIPP